MVKGPKEASKIQHFSSMLQIYQGTKRERLISLYNDWRGCTSCELGKIRNLNSQRLLLESPQSDPLDIVFGDGDPDTADVLIVGEAPGEEETMTQIPFVGRAGQLLNRLIAMTTGDPEMKETYRQYNSKNRNSAADVQEFTDYMKNARNKEFFITNAIACRPPENRTPTPSEIKECWGRLLNTIYIIDPLIIIACGNAALAALTQRTTSKITQSRGKVFDVAIDGHLGKVIYPMIPIYHPSYLLRKADWRVKGGDWDKTVDDFLKTLRIADSLRQQYYGTPPPDRKPL